jgi:hypothetical protein
MKFTLPIKQRKSPIGRHRHPHGSRRKWSEAPEVITTGEILGHPKYALEGAPVTNEGRQTN